MKTQTKTNLTWILAIFTIATWAYLYHIAVPIGRAYLSPNQTVKTNNQGSMVTHQAEASEIDEDKLPMKDYILYKVEQAGLNPQEVACLVEHEGGWSETAYHVNNNHTVDVGPFQGNSVHFGKSTDIKCMTDYKCATKWFIQKRLADGNYNAWYGYANGNCKRFK